MRPDRFEHELSEFIDGRLPSGRREHVLSAIDAEPHAEQILDEMEAARDLARSLPPVEVSADFATTLWERIRAGEGTPDAVFREPLSLWTKARYVASGAAAAAITLAAISLLHRAPPTSIDATTPNAPVTNQVADAAPEGRLRPATPFFNVAQVLPESVARAGRSECFDAVAALQTRASDLERRLDVVTPRQIVSELDPVVGRARGSTQLIRWMQRENMVELPADFDTVLTLTEGILDRMHLASSSNDRSQLRVAVQDLKSLQVERLRRSFKTVCCREPQEFQSLLLNQIVANPNVGAVLRVEISSSAQSFELRPFPGEPFGRDPLNGAVLILQVESDRPSGLRPIR